MAFTSFECAVARKISHQDFAVCFVLVTDEAKAKKEAAETVAFIVHWLFRGADAFLLYTHFANGCDEVAVGFVFFQLRQFVEPREGNAVLV
ncbi:hypothetical protein [Clostridium sp. KNHs205]|uniref:hypothetical protein n=1 Tax=Clostridium sp. KNHs205 TaxID=1449050 RepID=UPI00051B019D